jgi:hypothetical protein
MEKNFLYLVQALVLMYLTACNTPVMTPQGFESIQPGTPIEIVESQFGPPYEVDTLPNGFQEYTYIQRIPISPKVVDQVTYILYVCKGKVISKNIKTDQGCVDLNLQ